MNHRNRSNAIVLPLLLGATLLLATPVHGEDEGPITLDADEAEIDNDRGVSVYTGNVVLTRGGRQVTGDRMTVHLRGDDQLDHVVVEGEPGHVEPELPAAAVHAGEA